MPMPGIGYNLFYVTVCRLPARKAADFFRPGNEHGRITGTTRCFFHVKITARNLLGGFNHVPDAETVLRAQVKVL